MWLTGAGSECRCSSSTLTHAADGKAPPSAMNDDAQGDLSKLLVHKCQSVVNAPKMFYFVAKMKPEKPQWISTGAIVPFVSTRTCLVSACLLRTSYTGSSSCLDALCIISEIKRCQLQTSCCRFVEPSFTPMASHHAC